jgi:hypothetical protein
MNIPIDIAAGTHVIVSVMDDLGDEAWSNNVLIHFRFRFLIQWRSLSSDVRLPLENPRILPAFQAMGQAMGQAMSMGKRNSSGLASPVLNHTFFFPILPVPITVPPKCLVALTLYNLYVPQSWPLVSFS